MRGRVACPYLAQSRMGATRTSPVGIWATFATNGLAKREKHSTKGEFTAGAQHDSPPGCLGRRRQTASRAANLP